MLMFFLQLETMIGKVKAEKYGNRILGEIEKWSAAQSQNASQEEKGDENRAPKRPKTIDTHVVIESSDEEA